MGVGTRARPGCKVEGFSFCAGGSGMQECI